MPKPARPRVRFPRPLPGPRPLFRPKSLVRPRAACVAALIGTLIGSGGGCAALPALGGPGNPPVAEADPDDADPEADGGVQLAGAEGPADDSPFYGDDDALRSTTPEQPGVLAKPREWLKGLTGRKGEAEVSATRLPPEARQAFEAARNDLERGEHKRAASAFKSLSRRYADTAIEEDSLFYRAEALYAAEDYAPAQDAYDTLLDRYPSTRRLDVISKRQFDIARRWLGFPEAVVSADVKPVSYAEVAAGSPPPPPAERYEADAPPRPFDPTLAVPVLPNFHDSTRPLFDTNGRALQALKNVWMNDPTGELADDALFLSAGYYFREGDYLEAGRLYDVLRKEYPNSPHVKDAYLLGAHVREISWIGPAYDDSGLKESRQIKESFQRLYPEEADRARIAESLANMAEAQGESHWSTLQLYQRKGNPTAVAICARRLIVEHPGTQAAVRARKVWDELPAEAKRMAGPLPTAPGFGARSTEAPPSVERSVRPPVARPEERPQTPPARPAAPPRSVEPAPLPGSTQPPDDPFTKGDPFSGDPFSGAGDPFTDSGPFG
ncbi:outer membrane protein assembly factor BamD [Alienimonas californiensis]|uniref:Outer membrane protein assembly factor BamD n=1 Tax=Alienimonas californiensis TaxID=2527989 RepID=A0A517P602_9PLAN|nr:outer membrane protein assembly factor BamD [Alienimonas californiensis]QDT14792.1 Outer membrane protein assembly factor BamD [Alienimonas californiensis]